MHVDRYHPPQPEWTFPNAKINLYATIESVTFNFGDFDEPTGMYRLELATKMD